MALSWTGHRADNIIIENFGIRPRSGLRPQTGSQIYGSQLSVIGAILALGLVGIASPWGAAPQQEQPRPATQPSAPQDPPPPPTPEQPVFRAGVNFVRVDVIVSARDGKPVLDLTEKISRSSKTETASIESFKLVQVRTPVPGQEAPRQIRTNSDEEVEASRDDARVIAIFLDDHHVRRINSMKVRQPLLEFIENRLSPTDILAVMHPLTPLTEVRLTRNHASVASAIARFEGRKFDYQPMNDIEARVRTTRPTWWSGSDADHGCDEGVGDPLGGLREGRSHAGGERGLSDASGPAGRSRCRSTRSQQPEQAESICGRRGRPETLRRPISSAICRKCTTLPIGTTRLSTHSIRAGSPARNSVSTRTSTTRPIGDSQSDNDTLRIRRKTRMGVRSSIRTI